MINLKKTALAVLTLSSCTVFAGTMGPKVCTDENVTIPCANAGWSIGVKALYLKPSFSGQFAWLGSSAATVISPDGSSAFTATNYENSPLWHWGFKAEASYNFTPGNDIDINWYHIAQNTNRIYYDDVIPNFYNSFGLATPTSATVAFKPAWDAINLEVGQHVNFGTVKDIRFHAGVQFVRLKTQQTISELDEISFVAPFSNTTLNKTSFNGFGPRIGANYSYDVQPGWQVYADAATSILTGISRFNQNYADTFGNTASIPGNRTAFVPELEGTLGAAYNRPLAHGVISLDAGYMWVNYFNAETFITQDTDFGLQGPFIGIKWFNNI